MFLKSFRPQLVVIIKKIIQNLFSDNVLLLRSPDSEMVALTFDDGPHPEHTPQILEILRKNDIKATFFLLGSQIKMYPEIVKKIIDQGHEIANHTFSHEDLRVLNKSIFYDAVLRVEKILDSFRDTDDYHLFRTPYGRFNLKLLWLTRKYGLKLVGWTKDSQDSYIRNSEELVNYINSLPVYGGDILLFHEDYTHTVEALPEIICNLIGRKIRFATVGQLISKSKGNQS